MHDRRSKSKETGRNGEQAIWMAAGKTREQAVIHEMRTNSYQWGFWRPNCRTNVLNEDRRLVSVVAWGQSEFQSILESRYIFVARFHDDIIFPLCVASKSADLVCWLGGPVWPVRPEQPLLHSIAIKPEAMTHIHDFAGDLAKGEIVSWNKNYSGFCLQWHGPQENGDLGHFRKKYERE